MLKTERPTQRATTATRHPERIAWVFLLSGFAVFCMIFLFGLSYVYTWLSRPTSGEINVQVTQPLAVQVQREGLVKEEVLPDGQHLSPGDRVIVREEATPGVATTLRFGSASVALWAGTDVKIGRFGEQWNDPSAATARLRLKQGQIVVELADNDERIEIDTELGSAPVVLESPGRYRVRIVQNNSPTTATAERSDEPLLEVATERGLALLGDVEVKPGQRVLDMADGQVSRLTRWELVRDGDFKHLVDSVLPQTKSPPLSALSWTSTAKVTVEGAAKTGQVRPTQECANPLERTDCEQPYVRLVRKGGNTKGFSTAIAQQVEADVAAYERVRLRADIKVVEQSLSKAGESGTECPMLIRVKYTNDRADGVQKDYCFWAIDRPGQNGVVADQPYIETRQLEPDTWYSFDKDLKLELENLVKITEISFQANGHDYEAQVRDVRLTAERLGDIPAIR